MFKININTCFLVLCVQFLFLISCNSSHDLNLDSHQYDTIKLEKKSEKQVETILNKAEKDFKADELTLKEKNWFLRAKINQLETKGFQRDKMIYYCEEGLKSIKDDKTLEAYKLRTFLYNVLAVSYFEIHDCKNAIASGVNSVIIADSIRYNQTYAYYNLGMAYDACGNLEKFRSSMENSLKTNPLKTEDERALLSSTHHNLAYYYDAVEKWKAADVYLNLAINYYKENNEKRGLAEIFNEKAINLEGQQQKDSAQYYYKKSIELSEEIDRIIPFQYRSYSVFLRKEHNLEESKLYLDKALKLANKNHLLDDKSFIYQEYASLYKELGDYQKSNFYLDSALILKDKNWNTRLSEETSAIQRNFAIKEKEILIENLQYQNENTENALKIRTFIAALVIVLLAAITLYIFQRSKINELREKSQKVALEQKLFASQMNPHFIFNALSAIQAEILNQNTKEANKYLTKFGHLLQNILSNTQQDFLPIHVEYQNLIKYVELQQIRFKGFSLELDVYDGIDDDMDLIPTMLLQPLVENAIEHGLKQLDYEGILYIRIQKLEKQLECEIRDNGNGLNSTKTKKGNGISTGLIHKRLEYLSKEFKTVYQLIIQNNTEKNGVTVFITLPYKS